MQVNKKYVHLIQQTNTTTMKNETATQTFLFDFLKSELKLRNSIEITQDVLNTAYRKTIEFLNDEENKSKLKQAVKNLIDNGK